MKDQFIRAIISTSFGSQKEGLLGGSASSAPSWGPSDLSRPAVAVPGQPEGDRGWGCGEDAHRDTPPCPPPPPSVPPFPSLSSHPLPLSLSALSQPLPRVACPLHPCFEAPGLPPPTLSTPLRSPCRPLHRAGRPRWCPLSVVSPLAIRPSSAPPFLVRLMVAIGSIVSRQKGGKQFPRVFGGRCLWKQQFCRCCVP